MSQFALAETFTPDFAESVTNDVAYLRTAIVNVFFVGMPGRNDDGWVLIDAGMYGSAQAIAHAAASRFGNTRPAAILMTHAHFDHVGALRELAEMWDVPVYAHPLEHPYLNGTSPYPPPDPTVGGGALAALSFMYPRGPIDIGTRLRTLPPDGTVPFLQGWRWIHTPGHTPGHVSFFRDADRFLIAGDAVITTKQESMSAVLAQRPELHGPPMYYTQDWGAARDSVRRLAELEPRVLATGHGIPLQGERMLADLRSLAENFDAFALPSRGRYLRQPAIADETGTVAYPAPAVDARKALVLGGVLVLAAALVRKGRRR